ncbi:MAG TPA: hypothetical protein VMW72_19415 [Sedimentisphaerales bacterium]|nr:hypothetical protein [Sedimentisphaerales bacterium]
MPNRSKTTHSWLSKLIVAGLAAIAAMVVALVVVLVRDVRVWAVIGVGGVVFITVLIVLSINRYRWMAWTILGGLVTGGSWVGRGLSASAQLSESTIARVVIEASTWVEPVSLTICFSVLIVLDVCVNHVLPLIDQRNRHSNKHIHPYFSHDVQGRLEITAGKDSIKAIYEGPMKASCLQQLRNLLESSAFSVTDNSARPLNPGN